MKMKLRLPDYYKNFRCIAERCTDNCCIGWEICIDSETMEFYNSVEGDFGNRLRDNIKDGSFVLCGERCPFLNDKNLCDIIINLGENRLCGICAEHPRYYGWYGDIKEGGIGLCCEEAARIILECGNSGSFFEKEIPNEETEECESEIYDFLFCARENIFRFLERDDISFENKVSVLFDYAEKIQDGLDFEDFDIFPVEESEFSAGEGDIKSFVSAFEDFEPIDDSWTEALGALSKKKLCVNEKYLTNIFIYFVWRYFMRAVYDGDVFAKISLAAISAVMIALMSSGEDLKSYIMAAKLYSKEIEYSEENLSLMLEMCYTESGFSAENLLNLLS